MRRAGNSVRAVLPAGLRPSHGTTRCWAIRGSAATAVRLGATPAQIALAWTLSLAPNVLLIPGTSSVPHLEENLAAANVTLDEQAQRELTAARG